MGKYDDIRVMIQSDFDEIARTKENFKNSAEKRIPDLCSALKEEGYDKDQIKDKVEKDTMCYWSKETIAKFIPDEFKNIKRVEAGKKNRAKQLVTVKNDGQQGQESAQDTDGLPESNRVSSDSDGQKGQESSTFQNIVNKFSKAGIPLDDPKDEKTDDLLVKLNDIQVELDQTTTKLINSERNWIKKEKELTDKIAELEQLHKSNPNFKPASELVKPTSTNPDDDTSPVLRSVYKKTIGELNTRILELKDQLNKVQKYDEVIEIKNQKIALVIEAANLKSVTVDEAKSRRLN